MNAVREWFTKQRGWRPFGFQQRSWSAYLAGRSGLIHAPTGMGKTYAAWLGPLMDWCQQHPDRDAWAAMPPPALQVLWLTPLRALAADTACSLQAPLEELGLPWTLELRTGDVSSSVKARQRKRLPTALVTTPESLSLLLSYPDAEDKFRHLACVVVDEWHELLGTKRGTQAELCLARLRRWNPSLRVWGLSATLGNLAQARDVLMGSSPHAAEGLIIHGDHPKTVAVDAIIPQDIERFPWSGHLGLRLLPQVLAKLEQVRSALLFTNTRSQAELWFTAIMRRRPDWIGQVALHHGSLDHHLRQRVEAMLRAGLLRCVVCTSSLDLGVDFGPVDAVFQVGSPKGVARLMQRAGRSGHQPGQVSRAIGVPTHAWELIELAAAGDAMARGKIESREPLEQPLDVLVQHLVTLALGGGFHPQEIYEEVRSTYAYRALSQREWRWAMDFVQRGGPSLRAYPRFARVQREARRRVVGSPHIAQMHRLSIGTITSDAEIAVRLVNGRTLGTLEESFIARLRAGDRFVFAGQVLELIGVRGMTAWAQRAKQRSGLVPRWQGGRSPLSTQLAHAVRRRLEEARAGRFDGPPMQAVRPLLELQQRWSAIPRADELLIEHTITDEGHHYFLYPFQGRLVHEGLGVLLAYRLAQQAPRSITAAANDYGLELMCPDALNLDEPGWRRVLSPRALSRDLEACLNTTELARRQFRQIARVAGLVVSGYPGREPSARYLQASSDLFYDVFCQFDPHNLLLAQARREVLQQQLEAQRLRRTLQNLAVMRIILIQTPRLTPLAFPLWADRLRQSHVSSEAWIDRVRRMHVALESAADSPLPPGPPRLQRKPSRRIKRAKHRVGGAAV